MADDQGHAFEVQRLGERMQSPCHVGKTLSAWWTKTHRIPASLCNALAVVQLEPADGLSFPVAEARLAQLVANFERERGSCDPARFETSPQRTGKAALGQEFRERVAKRQALRSSERTQRRIVDG